MKGLWLKNEFYKAEIEQLEYEVDVMNKRIAEIMSERARLELLLSDIDQVVEAKRQIGKIAEEYGEITRLVADKKERIVELSKNRRDMISDAYLRVSEYDY